MQGTSYVLAKGGMVTYSSAKILALFSTSRISVVIAFPRDVANEGSEIDQGPIHCLIMVF